MQMKSGSHEEIQWGLANTALHFATMRGHTECIVELLGSGANVDCTTPDGTTPLMMACREGHSECVKILLSHGADVDLKDCNSQTAQEIARMERDSPRSNDGHFVCEQMIASALKADSNNPSDSSGQALLDRLLEPHCFSLPRLLAAVRRFKVGRDTVLTAARTNKQFQNLLMNKEVALSILDHIILPGYPHPSDLLGGGKRDTSTGSLSSLSSQRILVSPEGLYYEVQLVCAGFISMFPPMQLQHLGPQIWSVLFRPFQEHDGRFTRQCHSLDPVRLRILCKVAIGFLSFRGMGQSLLQFLAKDAEENLLQAESNSSSNSNGSSNGSHAAKDGAQLAAAAAGSSPLPPVVAKKLAHISRNNMDRNGFGIAPPTADRVRRHVAIVDRLRTWIGDDTIHELMLRIIFSSLTLPSVQAIKNAQIIPGLLKQLIEWQKLYAWGWHSPFQRDTVQNCSALLRSFLNAPYVSMKGDIINTEPHLKSNPRISDGTAVHGVQRLKALTLDIFEEHPHFLHQMFSVSAYEILSFKKTGGHTEPSPRHGYPPSVATLKVLTQMLTLFSESNAEERMGLAMHMKSPSSLDSLLGSLIAATTRYIPKLTQVLGNPATTSDGSSSSIFKKWRCESNNSLSSVATYNTSSEHEDDGLLGGPTVGLSIDHQETSSPQGLSLAGVRELENENENDMEEYDPEDYDIEITSVTSSEEALSAQSDASDEDDGDGGSPSLEPGFDSLGDGEEYEPQVLGSAILPLLDFFFASIKLGNPVVDQALAECQLVPRLLMLFERVPKNNLVHNIVTSMLQFVLVVHDYQEYEYKDCILLKSMFTKECNLLHFLMRVYRKVRPSRKTREETLRKEAGK
jgi:hypothetical protein